MTELGNKLKSLRIEKGYERSDLARIFEVKKSSIEAWESGKNRPNTQHLIELAKFYKVSMATFIDVPAEDTVSLENLADPQQELIFSLLKAFHSINSYSTKGIFYPDRDKLVAAVVKEFIR